MATSSWAQAIFSCSHTRCGGRPIATIIVLTIRKFVDGGVKTSHAARNLRAAIFRRVSAGLSGAALREAIAVAVHPEDVEVVG
ncbi:hypothetical protein ACVIDN_001345 [Rhizobium brockwellii]